jgi:hypothetical protein
MCLECRFIGCWSGSHLQAHLIQTNHSLGTTVLIVCPIFVLIGSSHPALDMLSGTIFCGPCDDFRLFERSEVDNGVANSTNGSPGELFLPILSVHAESFRTRTQEAGFEALAAFHGRESRN